MFQEPSQGSSLTYSHHISGNDPENWNGQLFAKSQPRRQAPDLAITPVYRSDLVPDQPLNSRSFEASAHSG